MWCDLDGYEDKLIPFYAQIIMLTRVCMLRWTCSQILGSSFLFIVAFLRYADCLMVDSSILHTHAYTKSVEFLCSAWRLYFSISQHVFWFLLSSVSPYSMYNFYHCLKSCYLSAQLCKCDVCAGVHGHSKCFHPTQKQRRSRWISVEWRGWTSRGWLSFWGVAISAHTQWRRHISDFKKDRDGGNGCKLNGHPLYFSNHFLVSYPFMLQNKIHLAHTYQESLQ